MKTVLLFVGGWILTSIPVSFLISRIFRQPDHPSPETPRKAA